MRSPISLPFDEIAPIIGGHPMTMVFIDGEAEYEWSFDDGAPWFVRAFVGRDDGKGSVLITPDMGVLHSAIRDLFSSPDYIARATDKFRDEFPEYFFADPNAEHRLGARELGVGL